MDSSYTRTGLSVLSNDASDGVDAYRTSIRNLAAWAETHAALRGQGLLSARPAAGKTGTFYKATDTATGVLHYDNGTTWETVGAAPPTDGSAATPSLRTLGSGSTQAAAGNHTHGSTMSRLVTKQNSAGQQNIVGVGTMGTTSVVAGNGVLGSWTQLVASTSTEFYLTGLISTTSSSTSPDAVCGVQIGIGGAGSEVPVFEMSVPLAIVDGTTTRTTGVVPILAAVRVAAGTRVAVRIYNASGAPGYGVIVYGVPYANLEGN